VSSLVALLLGLEGLLAVALLILILGLEGLFAVESVTLTLNVRCPLALTWAWMVGAENRLPARR
jgi:hypothetical protein